jgi:putative N-acetyltransferase (TIGR04045 family)
MTFRMPREVMPADPMPPRGGVVTSMPDRDIAVCRVARTSEERRLHWNIRHAVFVEEQHVFADTDLDLLDDQADVLLCIGYIRGVIAGAVRLYPLDVETGVWQGDRLAVLPAYRTASLGAPLVQFAVNSARLRGGSSMLAHIQLGNVRFFQRLGWHPVGELETYVGLPHQQMRIAW